MAGIDIISDSTGKEIVAAIQSTDVAQARILEINAAAESKKNEVLESIPEDYSNIVNEVDELKKDIGVERARIDSFTKLPEGSTTGDAELQDIRVKADGTIAENAGNAVREQISELKSDFGNLRFSITENNLLHIERKG